MKIKDGIIAELENDYNDSLKNIEKVFLTNFLDLSFNSINNKLDNINELFIINNKLNWLNSELYNTTIKKGFAGIWTRIVGFKVQSANHYTTRPLFTTRFELENY